MKKNVIKVQNYIRRKENIKKIFFEFIAAFMGVLIAMGLSNWQQNRKEDDFIRKSVASIYHDNIKNIENIKLQLNDLETYIDTFNYYKNDETYTIRDIINKNKYLRLQSVQFDGWEILERSNLIYKLDYDVASQLSNLEDQSEIIEVRRKGIIDIYYNSPYNTTSKDKKTMRINLNGLKQASNFFLHRALIVDSLLQLSYNKDLDTDTIHLDRNEL